MDRGLKRYLLNVALDGAVFVFIAAVMLFMAMSVVERCGETAKERKEEVSHGNW
jgi:hypothetical protein